MTDFLTRPRPAPGGPVTAAHIPDADPAPVRLAALALIAGLAVEVGVRGGPSNLVVAAGIGIALLTLLADRRIRRKAPRRLVIAALVLTVFLAVRASPWLAAANLGMIVLLVTLAVVFARSPSLVDTTPRRLVRRIGPAIGRGLLGIPQLAGTGRPTGQATRGRAARRQVARGLRATLVVAPLLLVLVALLAAADPVFARLLVPDIDVAPSLRHLILTVLGAASVVAVAAAAAGDADDEGVARGSFGTLEVTIMLGLVAAVIGLFSVSQLLAMTGAGRRVVAEAGLTPAEYARSGFFQLCLATAVLLTLLALVRGMARAEVSASGAVRLLGGLVPLMALGLVAVSLRRMALYDDAFGLTMLRLCVVGAALWLGVTLLMVAARNLGVGGGRDWVVTGAVTAALVLVVVADVVGPEAFVVRHNLARATAGAELDVAYLAGMSDDAVPALIEAAGAGSAGGPVTSLDEAIVCRRREPGGVEAWNLARRRAVEANRSFCGRSATAAVVERPESAPGS